ncbi:YodC family protein [Xanthobacter pseudotagetidis]|uniref:YodC family protein n=1 Tax=Xanthobacter pseudotagetidis TaxID=3119911 RepID=UPI0037279EF8
MAFGPGDIVQLKSGSPALTVVGVDGDEVKVFWYADEVGEFRAQTLPSVALEPLDLDDFADGEEDEDDEEDDEDEKD